MFESFVQSIATLSPGWLYLALFASAYVENIFPPVPGDTVTVFAAYVVGRTQQHFAGVFVATTLGSVAGFMNYYVIGRMVPIDFFIERNYRFFPAETFRKAGAWFQRYGYWIVLGNRFLSGIRGVISIVTGVYRMPWLPVLLLTTISCAAWNGLLIWGGYLLGSNWRAIEEILRQYARIVAAVVVLAGIFWATRRHLARSR
jgi:membrane protein DedA with SNARE-associated domain